MSRRHHGRPHHARHRNDGPRPDAGAPRPASPAPDRAPLAASPVPLPEPIVDVPHPAQPAPAASNGAAGAPTPATPAGLLNGDGGSDTDSRTHGGDHGGERPNGVTAPQLRRFIKSRPYVPMHELRRRFGIDGTDDDVTPVQLDGSRVFVGLPIREGGLLGELLRGGEIGYELSFDPLAPIVVGVYPMRPVPRT